MPLGGSANENAKGQARSQHLEPLPPLVSAALEPGNPSLGARIQRLAAHASGKARYTVLGEVAQGGMGRILRAWDESLSREVAMKVVAREPAANASEDERAEHERRLTRFVDEARISAQLDHPGIVPVYEIGLDEKGGVFFTMPLVRGRDLKGIFAMVYRGEQGWTLQRAVDVMHKVCLTVAFAHSKGVVHRDLKPENVMVGPYGEAYVMDWGLAHLLGRSERAGIVGTPAYMAPEQAAGRTQEVGARTDVYSLGAILYELFARRLPHELSLEARTGESFESVLASPPRPLEQLAPHVPPELAAVCAKAMAHDPRARYASALEMAEDLAAWLAGRTVSALDTGRWTRLLKWRARNRALALALDALVVVSLIGAATVFLQQRSFVREVQAKQAETLASAYAAGLSAADLGLRAHETGDAKRRLAACAPELRGWEWRHLARRADASERVLLGHDGGVRTVAVSPDGRSLASGADDGAVVLWDVAQGKERARLLGHASVVTCVAFSPDGTRVASASRDKGVRLWDAASGELERQILAHEGDVTALAFSGDGRLLASGDAEGTLALTAVAGGERRALRSPPTRDALIGLDFVPGTDELAAAYLSGFVRLHGPDLEVRRATRAARSTLSGLDADPNGCFLAVIFERTALVLDATTLAPVMTLAAHGSPLGAVAFAPDGRRLATSGYDNVLRVWDLQQGLALREFDGHDSDVNAVAFFADGQHLVTGAEDESLRLWDLDSAPVLVLEGHGDWVASLAFAPDGRQLASGARDRFLRLFDTRSGQLLEKAETPAIVDALAWSAQGEILVGCGESAARRARPAALGAWSALPAGAGFPVALCVSADGERLFLRDSQGPVRVLALGAPGSAARELATLPSGPGNASLALSLDGAWLAAGESSGEVHLWDARTLAPRATLGGTSGVNALAFSPDGTRLAIGRKNRIALCATRDGTLERTLGGHENLVSCLAFSPDGTRLVSGAYDHTLRVWDPLQDEALLTLHGHAGPITAVAFDASGEVLASGSKDDTIRLWRTGAPGRP